MHQIPYDSTLILRQSLYTSKALNLYNHLNHAPTKASPARDPLNIIPTHVMWTFWRSGCRFYTAPQSNELLHFKFMMKSNETCMKLCDFATLLINSAIFRELLKLILIIISCSRVYAHTQTHVCVFVCEAKQTGFSANAFSNSLTILSRKQKINKQTISHLNMLMLTLFL